MVDFSSVFKLTVPSSVRVPQKANVFDGFFEGKRKTAAPNNAANVELGERGEKLPRRVSDSSTMSTKNSSVAGSNTSLSSTEPLFRKRSETVPDRSAAEPILRNVLSLRY